MSNQPTDDPLAALRALANRWAMNARDYAREAKSPSIDAEKAAFNRGMAEAFYKAALDMAGILKGVDSLPQPTSALDASARSTSVVPAAAPPKPAAPPPHSVTYLPMSVGEAIQLLEFAGVSARDVNVQKDNSVFAVFSRWQPIADPERLAMIKAADTRIVILRSGRDKDTHDPYIEFAIQPTT